MSAYTDYLGGTTKTPQRRVIPGREKQMSKNNAEGFSFDVSAWERYARFLILGSEGGTYYVGERDLTKQNVDGMKQLLREDGQRFVDMAVDVSHNGKAPKNEPAILAMALALNADDEATRQYAEKHLGSVVRIGTHRFTLLAYLKVLGGMGTLKKRALASLLENMDPGKLAYQVTKYQSRKVAGQSWSNRDYLRISHPQVATEEHGHIYDWICGKEIPTGFPGLRSIYATELLKVSDHPYGVIDLIRGFDNLISWEQIPTKFLNYPEVWHELLPGLPLTALTRNLGRMTANGALTPMSEEVDLTVRKLSDSEYIRRSRLHPLSILVALKTYQSGMGRRGSLRWHPISQIVDALDGAFYLAFQNIQASGKRIMLALDVSASMNSPDIAGMTGITPRVGSAAMAMVTMRTEQNVIVTGFTSGGGNALVDKNRRHSWGSAISTLDLSPRQRLDDVVRRVSELPFGGTDCALPMLYALERGLDIDAFVVYTDGETWAGEIHPAQALQQYRQRTGIAAKLVVVGMVSNGFSIADPDDMGMLDVVGFDTTAPQVISQFIAE